MNDERLRSLLADAVAAAREAGSLLLRHFESDLQIETKSSGIDLVTVADREAEALLVQRLKAAAPDFGIHAEESGRHEGAQGAPQWVVDPLDGTTNFAHGYPQFSVSIGLAEAGVPVLGVVHDPSRGETFAGARGLGATREAASGASTLSGGRADALSRSLLGTGFGYQRATAERNNLVEFNRAIRKVRGIRRAGSAALDLAWVAAGRLDAFWEFDLSPWDWCAGALLVREAGGVIETVDGEPFTLDGASIMAGPAGLVAELRSVLRP